MNSSMMHEPCFRSDRSVYKFECNVSLRTRNLIETIRSSNRDDSTISIVLIFFLPNPNRKNVQDLSFELVYQLIG